ncbi:kinesin-like protein Klp98A [Pollicipes pollicipes]|uniref:kinesin-like protein Klp98A n=1 Tax=Pollicipes pollicipes TaxID=41117 RepID=UPI0018851667|nr:kinesin-like protein Klp98A [Pollicipes pollicipes]
MELCEDDELMGAFIEQEVQRRVSEQLVLQEQRLRAERAHQQLLNERQLARLHFSHQRQIRKLKSALSSVYASVPALTEQLAPDMLLADDRAASSPRLAGGESSPSPATAVAVPRFLLRGVGRDAHFEYEVRVTVPGERYTIYRRYQRFRDLQKYTVQRYGEPASAARLPPARLFGRTSEALATERRGQLEEYLRQLLERCATLPGCPLNQGLSRRSLADFAPFFQRGVFEFTRAMTS